jgi:hypothetical protein
MLMLAGGMICLSVGGFIFFFVSKSPTSMADAE